jgi:hypothetical protein
MSGKEGFGFGFSVAKKATTLWCATQNMLRKIIRCIKFGNQVSLNLPKKGQTATDFAALEVSVLICCTKTYVMCLHPLK